MGEKYKKKLFMGRSKAREEGRMEGKGRKEGRGTKCDMFIWFCKGKEKKGRKERRIKEREGKERKSKGRIGE